MTVALWYDEGRYGVARGERTTNIVVIGSGT
jgi:hypothetical protein